MLQKEGMPMFASQTSHTSNWGSLVVLQIPAGQWPPYLAARKILVWWSSASLRLLFSILRQTPSSTFNIIQPTVPALCLSSLHHIVRCNCRRSNQECYLNTNTTLLMEMDQLPLLYLKEGFLLVVMSWRVVWVQDFSPYVPHWYNLKSWTSLAERLPRKHKLKIHYNVHQFPLWMACLQELYHYPGKWQGCMPKGCPPGIDKDNMLSPGDAFLTRGIGESAIWFLLFRTHQVNLNSKKSATNESHTCPRDLAMTPWWKVPSALCEQHRRFCVVDHCIQDTKNHHFTLKWGWNASVRKQEVESFLYGISPLKK